MTQEDFLWRSLKGMIYSSKNKKAINKFFENYPCLNGISDYWGRELIDVLIFFFVVEKCWIVGFMSDWGYLVQNYLSY